MKLEFIPFKRIGKFKFKDRISLVIKDLNYEYLDKDQSGYESFILNDLGVSLYVEDNLIESIACDQECYFKGINIIGMNFKDFLRKMKLVSSDKKEAYEMANSKMQEVYEVDEIGLQVWVEDNLINTVIAMYFDTEDN